VEGRPQSLGRFVCSLEGLSDEAPDRFCRADSGDLMGSALPAVE
jgi:hypothetical protein